MGEQAVALAKAVGYDSAGTVEFVAGQDRSFYFLEMNTRLQVEHPVTELVTGLDLVELMIRSAAGEKLPLKQADVKLKGWAIESRIYAEDPYRNFLPSIGRLVKYRPPAEGSSNGLTIRNDTGVTEGGEISMFYDPMIAKLVTHGPTREAAIDHMAEALDAFAIEGIQHNIPFLTALMQSPRWRSGKLSTGFIREEYPAGFKPRVPDQKERELLAAVAAQIDHLGNSRRRQISGQITGPSVRFARQRIVDVGGVRIPIEISGELGGPTSVSLLDDAGKAKATVEVVTGWWPGQPVWTGTVGGKPVSVLVRPIANGHLLAHRGMAAATYVYTRREAELAALMPAKSAADTSRLLLCPMPGLIKAVYVKEGAEVKAGDSLAVVEAMKMENILKAERDAVVKSVKAKAGDSLAVDAVIIEFA
jgi:propionyl-CoA carboxylase alpha chain